MRYYDSHRHSSDDENSINDYDDFNIDDVDDSSDDIYMREPDDFDEHKTDDDSLFPSSTQIQKPEPWSKTVNDFVTVKDELKRLDTDRLRIKASYNTIRERILRLLSKHDTDTYIVDGFLVFKEIHKGPPRYKQAMLDICNGETEEYSSFVEKHKSPEYYIVNLKRLS